MSSSGRPDGSPAPKRRRTSILVARRTAVALAWVATLVLAFVAGVWSAGSGWQADAGAHGPATESTVARAELDPATTDPLGALPEPAPSSEDAVEDEPEPAAPAPKPAAKPMPREKAPPPPPPVEPPAEPVEAAPAAPAVSATELARRADTLAVGGDEDDARREAEALLATHGSFTALTAALAGEGADEVAARLTALRVLQLAGLESEATELARELKRSHLGTPEVLKSIRSWRLLTPRITRLDSSIEDDKRVVVTGTLVNPDIGEIRRVFVQVDGLDAAGNVLTTTRARVRPKALAPGSGGSFTVRFDDVDPASILRTRATVVEWESEVLEPS